MSAVSECDVWPFVSAALGPPPLPAPSSTSSSNKSLSAASNKMRSAAAASVPGAAVNKESDRLAPVYSAPNPRWTPELRAGWLNAAQARRGGTLAPTTIPGEVATAELVLDHLARDGAVIIGGLAPPSVCTDVVTQKNRTSWRADGCLALASPAAHVLIAHPLVVQVCDAVLACQALRMPESELSEEKLVLGGSFTSQRPLRQLAWEIDYARCDGKVHRNSNPAPAVPSLLALEQQLTAVWQLSESLGSSLGTAGHLLSPDGIRIPVKLGEVGSVLLALGGGVSRWQQQQQQQQQQQLQAIGYQLGFMQPAQNHYLLAATNCADGDEDRWYHAVDALPLYIQRLLGFHMPGQVLNKVYAAPGPPDILSGLGALAGHPINWAHSMANSKMHTAAPAVEDSDTQRYMFPHAATDTKKLQVMRRAQEVADTTAAALGVPPPASVTELVSREPELDHFFRDYTPLGPPGGPNVQSVGSVTTVDSPEIATEQQEGGQSFGTTVKKLIAALDKDGAVVLSQAVSGEVCNAIQDEIAPYSWEARGMSATTGGVVNEGYATGSNGSLLAKSTAVQAMAAHPVVVATVEAVLGRQILHPTLGNVMQSQLATERRRLGWRVHVDLTIPKEAGAGKQQLHRDGDLSIWDCQNELDHAVSVIWALDGDFTNARGTTRVVLGSHHWERGRVAVESEAVGAEMPRGSALIYVGRTFHGAGANSTKSTRVALNIAYNSSFLKQECNTFVTATPVQVRRMQIPSLVSELLGYVGSDADFLKPQQQQKTVARL